MRRRPLPAVWLLSLFLIASAPCITEAQAIDLDEKTVALLDLSDETLQEALFAIIEGTGLSHIIPKFGTEQDSLSIGRLHLRDISVADALTLVLEPLGLTYRQEENFLRILPNIEERIIRFKYLASRFAGGMSGGAQGGAGGA